MTVPLVQGTLRYAYKIGEVPSDRSQKNAAEGATFAAAVLPMVASCNAAAAATVTSNVKFGLYDAGTYPNYANVLEAMESTYTCLGITCAHVGSLSASVSGFSAKASCTANLVHAAYDSAAAKVAPVEAVTVVITAAGAVTDYDDAKKADLECRMASKLAVGCDKVTLKVSAASVLLEFTVAVADAAAATAMKATIDTAVADTSVLSYDLGVTVEAVAAATEVSYSPPSAPPSSDDLPGGAIAGIVIGCLVGVVLLGGGVAYMALKGGKGKQPEGGLEMKKADKV